MTLSVARAAVSSFLMAGLVALALGQESWAAAPRDSITLKAQTEAWYQQAPPCVALVDCSALPGASAYPENTLHVEISAGQERARTYLAFSLLELPIGSELLGGSLILPLDTDPAHGGFSAESADIVVCLVEAEFEPVRGSTGKPPDTACKSSAPAVFDAAASGFTVDLEPFVDDWGGGRGALALLPAEAAKQESSTWHVTLPATTEGSTKSIAATLEYTAPEEGADVVEGSPAPGGGVTNPLPATGSAPPSVPLPTGGVGAAASGGTTSPVLEPTVPAVAEAAPAAGGPAVVPSGFAGPGFAYPQVWALPLVLLAGFGAIGKSLTRELYRRR